MEKLNLTNFGVQEMDATAMSETEGGFVLSVDAPIVKRLLMAMVAPQWTPMRTALADLFLWLKYGL
jgi:hypothetical protein